ncbi:MAG TPA: TAXI family TRAP transporter solute-binding subunit [Xanthobacteraceae bacterium]
MVIGAVMSLATAATAQQVTDIPWGTSAVGSAGHKALVTLATVLNREMKDYQITVLPTPGAIITVKGYATGQQFLGYYGADVAFYELANDTARFKGFKAQIKRQPVQSFWAFTLEVGLGISAKEAGNIKQWRDLSGKQVFTGPLPWDTRAQAERALAALGIKHNYIELDLAAVGSVLNSGRVVGMTIYTNAESGTPPWLTEASLSADWAALNPSAEELAILKKAGFSTIELDPKVFKRDVHVPKVTLLPFYYGFHVGLEISENDVYRMLKIIEANLDELAKADNAYGQIKAGMAEMQRRGVASSVEFVPIHPGLAKYMREKGVWDSKWDNRIARKSS